MIWGGATAFCTARIFLNSKASQTSSIILTSQWLRCMNYWSQVTWILVIRIYELIAGRSAGFAEGFFFFFFSFPFQRQTSYQALEWNYKVKSVIIFIWDFRFRQLRNLGRVKIVVVLQIILIPIPVYCRYLCHMRFCKIWHYAGKLSVL